jgi:opacity protein-like surface antigen
MRKALVLVACLLVTGVALAQGRGETIELTPTVGYWFGDTLGHGESDGHQYDMRIDDATSYGLRLGYNFSHNWGLEFMLTREEADIVTGNDELFGGQKKLGTATMTTGEVSFLVGFGHGRLIPFLAGGIGAMNLNPSMSNSSSDTLFVGNFGVGFKLFFTPDVALRFDWRGHSVDNGNDEHHCDWWDDCHHDHNYMTFSEVALGLSFVF